MSKRNLVLMCSIFLIVPLLFMGCADDGSDGARGATGATGLTGPRGEDLTANPVPETCSVCHGNVAATHAQTGAVTVGNIASAVDGDGNLVTTFNVKVDGANSDSFILYRAYAHLDNALQAVPAASATPVITTGQRNTLYSLADNGAITGTPGAGIVFANTIGTGNYTVTVPAANVIDNADYLFIVKAPAAGTETAVGAYTLEGSAFATLGTTSLRDLVSDEGCTSCHGPTPAWSAKFRHYAVGGSKCGVCHSIVGRNVGIISLADNGTRVEGVQRAGTNAVEYFHGIHNSEGMPDNMYFRSTNPAGGENSYAIGYPSDMRNCKVCHTEPAQLTAASTAPVSFWLCMSCHQSWKSFPNAPAGHATTPLTDNTACAGCHVETVSVFHNSFEGVDSHYDSFYNGTDISFDNPDNVLFAIGDITKSGDNVAFTWVASKAGALVNPCNTDNAAGPTFQGLGAYLAYAKGDDWVNENLSASQSPGQPLSARNLFTSLSTTCDNTNKVATTTGLVVAAGAIPYAQKALLAIGGKPVTTEPTTGEQYFVRVASPTKAFSMATGDAVAARRSAVDTQKCIACHRGTLYQHGGDRVDNEQLCVICHNPSSSEKNVRVNYGITNPDGTVNTSATYDGKSAETYDMRYLLHAIHGAEKRDNPIIIYRSRGIFAFAPEGAAKPAGWPADETTPQPIAGSVTGATQTHTWTIIDYPKPANACLACHNEGLYEVPDQTKAVALTVEPGTSWTSQTDDVSIGPTAGACTGCHATSIERSHAYKQGYMANVIKEEMLQLADPMAWWLPPTP